MTHRTGPRSHRKAPRSTGQARRHTAFTSDVPPSRWKYLRPAKAQPGSRRGYHRPITFRWCVAVARWSVVAWWRWREWTAPLTMLAVSRSLVLAAVVGAVTAVDWVATGGGTKARAAYRFRLQVTDAIVRTVEAQQRKENQTNINPLRNVPSWLEDTLHYWPADRDGDGRVSLRELIESRLAGPPSPHSATAVVKLPLGVPDSAMSEIVHQLDRPLDADCSIKTLGQGRAELRVVYEDVLAHPFPYKSTERVSLAALPVGRNRWADVEYRALVGPQGARSWIFGGVTGSGKTSAINATLLDLIWLRLQGVRFVLRLVDPLGGVDLGWAHEFCDEVAETPEQAQVMLGDSAADVRARAAAMPRGLYKITGPNDEFPPRVLVVDELALLLRDGEGKPSAPMTGSLITMVTNGRKTGDAVIAATQMLQAKVLDPLVRNQFQDRIGLRTMTRSDSAVILGDKLDEVVNLAKIDEDQQGRCWWMSGRLTPLRLRGAWDRGLDREIAALKLLAKSCPAPVPAVPAPVLVPAGNGPDAGLGTGAEASCPPTEVVSLRRGDRVPRIEEAFRQVNGTGAKLELIAEMAGVSLSTVKYHVLEAKNIPTVGVGNARYKMVGVTDEESDR